jgi:sugar lactone lactonase YvrE
MLIVAAALAAPSIAMQGDTIADIVLGQPNLTDNPQNFISARGLHSPTSVAVDTTVNPNRLYVSDSANNRILGYNDVATLVTGGLADLVIGQPNFNSSGCNTGGLNSASLCAPEGVAVDASGNLYVTDNTNNRVLEYNTPFAECGSFPCVAAPANRVFGQGGSFTTGTCNKGSASANSLCGPFGVALDARGNLYVSDSTNNRVLEYNTPLTTDTTADKVFGQLSSFSSGLCNNGGINANTLCTPYGVALDSSGNLYVADSSNNRVLEYNTPLTTNTTADTVFGQSSFTTNVCNVSSASSTSLCSPEGVALDASSDLYVADYKDNRVLEYNTPLTTDTVADRVIGQHGSFSTTNFGGASASSLFEPAGLALDSSGNLYVADYGENSVFQYTTPLALNANANLVLGQDTFSDDGDDLEVTDASAISYPNSVAIDTSVVPNRLYVADQLNNRVLGWHDVTALSNDTPADLVIGQPDFVSSICNNGGVSASSLCLPGYLAVDSSGNLYAGDEGNHRVLEYNNPFSGCGSLPCVGGPANLVFGQGGSFTSNTANNGGISATSLNGPGGLALDPTGNLYVADPINSRVLELSLSPTPATAACLNTRARLPPTLLRTRSSVSLILSRTPAITAAPLRTAYTLTTGLVWILSATFMYPTTTTTGSSNTTILLPTILLISCSDSSESSPAVPAMAAA